MAKQKFSLPSKDSGISSAKTTLAAIQNKKAEEPELVKNIDYELLDPSGHNPYPTDSKITELKESLSRFGLLHNLVVIQRDNGRYEILSGESRYYAIGELLKEGNTRFVKGIRCLVLPSNTPEVDQDIIIEESNIIQREYTPDMLRAAIKRLSDLYAKKNAEQNANINITKELAEKTNLKERQIQKYRSINDKLIPELQAYFDNGTFNVNTASEYAQLPEDTQKLILSLIEQQAYNHKDQINAVVEESKAAKKKYEEEAAKLQKEIRAERINAKKKDIKLQTQRDELAHVLSELEQIEQELNKAKENGANDEEVQHLTNLLQQKDEEVKQNHESVNTLKAEVKVKDNEVKKLKKQLADLKNNPPVVKTVPATDEQLQAAELTTLQAEISSLLKRYNDKSVAFQNKYGSAKYSTEILLKELSKDYK